MPICGVGGAKCFAGPAEAVSEHEHLVHGKRLGGGRKPRQEVQLYRRPPKTDVERVEIDRIYRKRAAYRRR